MTIDYADPDAVVGDLIKDADRQFPEHNEVCIRDLAPEVQDALRRSQSRFDFGRTIVGEKMATGINEDLRIQRLEATVEKQRLEVNCGSTCTGHADDYCRECAQKAWAKTVNSEHEGWTLVEKQRQALEAADLVEAEYAWLRQEFLDCLPEYAQEGTEENPIPEHACGYDLRPDEGACDFHEHWYSEAPGTYRRLRKEAK